MGEAIGARAITTPEIEAISRCARRCRAASSWVRSGGAGEDRLKAVVTAARTLAASLGRKPTVAEIAAEAGLSEAAVKHALALLEGDAAVIALIVPPVEQSVATRRR